MAVPVHHGHGIPCFDSRLCQYVSQARYPLNKGRVGVAQLVPVDDLAGFLVAGARHQQPLDQQRVLVRAFGWRNHASLQHKNSFF